MKMRFVALAALALLPVLGNAAPCESEDFENRVSGASTCLLIKRFGVTETGAAQAMLIWLHGDLSSGGPARVGCGRMPRLHWQLPASRAQYHGKRDGVSIQGRARPVVLRQ